MSRLLEISGLEAGYGASQVLFGLDLAVEEGEVATLLGRNGMGKTTTVRALFGLLPPRGGTIRWRGEVLDGLSPQRVAHLGIALVPEGRQVFPNLTVTENLVAFAVKRGAAAWDLAKVLEFFPQLRERSSQLAGRLSGGEQQMLAIGRALMTNPALLVVDEATEGLAPLVREEVWRCFEALRAGGQALLLIDKHVERLVALADRHTIVERGRAVWTGGSEALRSDRSLWHRWLGV
ncbi:MAG TPA: ABC transporter ATP-binding protein [Usitatibacter sp.]|nr:ABC transporter ATP-binding protein [Usitatibacter sp.]